MEPSTLLGEHVGELELPVEEALLLPQALYDCERIVSGRLELVRGWDGIEAIQRPEPKSAPGIERGADLVQGGVGLDALPPDPGAFVGPAGGDCAQLAIESTDAVYCSLELVVAHRGACCVELPADQLGLLVERGLTNLLQRLVPGVGRVVHALPLPVGALPVEGQEWVVPEPVEPRSDEGVPAP